MVEGSVKYIWFDMHFKKCINTILKRSYGGREDISFVVQGIVRSSAHLLDTCGPQID